MGFTYKAVLNNTVRKDKTQAVLIRITKDRVHRYYTTGITISPKIWNENASYLKRNWVKPSDMAPIQNSAIKADIDGLMALGLVHATLSAEGLRDLYKQNKEQPAPESAKELCFIQLCWEEVARRSRREQSTIHTYITRVNKLSKYCGGSLPLSKLTISFLRDYVTHLEVKRGNVGSTIKENLSFLSYVAEYAMKTGLLDYTKNPFLHVSAPKHKTIRRTLSKSDIEALEVLPLKKRNLIWARDLFLAQFYIHGARMGDAMELKWDALQDRLRYTMRKNRKAKSLLMADKLMEVIERYRSREAKGHVFIFPYLNDSYVNLNEKEKLRERSTANTCVNYNLKQLAKMLGIEKFTSHSARHSFANLASSGKTDTRDIQSMLNHSSIATTERYLESFKEGHDDEATAAIYKQMKQQ